MREVSEQLPKGTYTFVPSAREVSEDVRCSGYVGRKGCVKPMQHNQTAPSIKDVKYQYSLDANGARAWEKPNSASARYAVKENNGEWTLCVNNRKRNKLNRSDA